MNIENYANRIAGYSVYAARRRLKFDIIYHHLIIRLVNKSNVNEEIPHASQQKAVL